VHQLHTPVSAVTFVTAVTFLENYTFSGHMVAVGWLLEAPAIIIGVILVKIYSKDSFTKISTLKHSFTNGSVLLILGSLLIDF
jgi:hypothetical protein